MPEEESRQVRLAAIVTSALIVMWSTAFTGVTAMPTTTSGIVNGVKVIKANVTKPVVGYIAGFTAPEGKTMGHAGAIISGSAGTADAKKEALEAAGVKVGKTPSETAQLMREIMQSL